MTVTEIKPIRTKRDYEAALTEIERLWGAKADTPEGDRLDVLATLIDAHEAKHWRLQVNAALNSLKIAGMGSRWSDALRRWPQRRPNCGHGSR